MSRQAAAFALIGFILGLAIVDQLQKAALIPAVALTPGRLAMSIMVLFLAGIAWSKLRYR